MSKTLAIIIARLILLMLKHLLAARERRAAQLMLEQTEQTDLPQQAAPTPVVSACRAQRRRGGAAWRQEFPQLARLIALVRHAPLVPDGTPLPQSEAAASNAGRAAFSPAALATSTFAPPPMRLCASTDSFHAAAPAWHRQVRARAGTGPPAGYDCQICCV